MKLIELDNGLMLEVEATKEEIVQISKGQGEDNIERVSQSIEVVEKILVQSVSPIFNAYNRLNQDVILEKAEVEIGIGFSAEGNVFISKEKGSSNLKVKLILTAKG